MASSTVAVPSGTTSVSPQEFSSQGSDNVDGGDIFTERSINTVANFTNSKF